MYLFSGSREFLHSGPKEKALLCAECRAHFKKFGELPVLPNNNNNNNTNNNNSSNSTNSSSNSNNGNHNSSSGNSTTTNGNESGGCRETPYLFRPVQTDSPDGSPGRMRTRNKAKETVKITIIYFVVNSCKDPNDFFIYIFVAY